MHPHVDIGDFLQATIALIAIANPFAALPVFLSLVPGHEAKIQRQAANRVALAVSPSSPGQCWSGVSSCSSSASPFRRFASAADLVVTLTGLDMLRREHPTRIGDDVATALSAPDDRRRG